MEEAVDLAGSDTRSGPDANTLGAIKLCWKKRSKRHSLQIPSSLRLQLVLDPPRAVGVRLSKY